MSKISRRQTLAGGAAIAATAALPAVPALAEAPVLRVIATDKIVQLANAALALSGYLDTPATENWSQEKLEAESARALAMMVAALQMPASGLQSIFAKLRIAHRIETFKPELDNVEPDCGPLDSAAIFWAIRRDLEALTGGDAS